MSARSYRASNGLLDLSRARVQVAVIVALSVLCGLVVSVQPLATVPLVVFASISVALRRPDKTVAAFGILLSIAILGYALFSRGFAYLGVRPAYIGEWLIVLGIASVIVARSRYNLPPLGWGIVVFMLMGLFRTVPYVATYKLDALRDAALWYYAIFALIVCMLGNHLLFERVRLNLGRPLPLALIALLISNLLWLPFFSGGPVTPGSSIPMFFVKNTDRGAILGSFGAFMLLGLARRGRSPGPGVFLWLLWLGSLPWVVAGSRGGTLAILAALLVVLVLRFDWRAMLKPVVLVAFLLIPVAIVNPEFEIGTDRPMSLTQFSANFRSILGSGNDPAGLAGTRNYRLEWWREIAAYTFGGDYFLTGKGFGVNLADDDGFQVTADSALRAPHNSHMTVLARMGVPGFMLWIGFQFAFGALLFRSIRKSRQVGDTSSAAFQAWLLATWLAMLVVTSFDPYLEGPQGAIPFWCVVGLGLISIRESASDNSVPVSPREH